MLKFTLSVVGLSAGLVLSAPGAALMALTSFGGGDGWLAPGETGFTPGADLARGMTYNPATNHLYVVDRTGGTNVRIYNGDTGAAAGTLNMTGVSGGTFPLNMIDVDANGVIYAANLSTSNASNFKVYRWADEAAVPTVAFDGLTDRTRTGDSFAVTGSGISTLFAAAGGSNAGQHYSLLSTTDGIAFTSTNPTLTDAVTGGFRLGIDFGPGGAVLGAQTGGTQVYSAANNGVVTNTNSTVIGEAPIAYYADGADSLMAMVDVATNTVRLYDDSLSAPALDTANLTTAYVNNGNGVGDLKFGMGPDGTLRLYALNANNGIQAFVVVPEPSAALLGLASLGLCFRRRR